LKVLECHQAVQRKVTSSVNHTHPAAAEDAEDFVARQLWPILGGRSVRLIVLDSLMGQMRYDQAARYHRRARLDVLAHDLNEGIGLVIEQADG
jgi:hypothetical protein